MLNHELIRAPKVLKRLMRPTLLPDDIRLDQNLGDVFIFQEFSIMRVYNYPQPPHILPMYIPPRLDIIEFVW